MNRFPDNGVLHLDKAGQLLKYGTLNQKEKIIIIEPWLRYEILICDITVIM